MPKFGGRTRLMSVGGVVLAGLIAIIGVVIFGRAAGAHTATLTPAAACQSDGTYTITYTGQRTNKDLTSTVTVLSDATQPDGTSVTPAQQDVAINADFEVTQTGVPGTATSAAVEVHVTWSDGVKADVPGSVKLDGDCAKPPTQVTAAKVTFANATCLHPTATYTIPPAVTGTKYQVNGNDVEDNKTYDATPGDVVTITAVALPGYELTGTKSWSKTFGPVPTNCTDTPTNTQPSCTSPNGTYTIPGTDNVVYFVNGTRTDKGTYPGKGGTTITVTAQGPNGETLPGITSWTLKFGAAPTDCSAHAPTFVDNTCTLSGSYTIPDTVADFTVNDVAVSAGKHSATAGSTIAVKAIARPGHPLTGPTSWTHTFPNLPPCAPPVAPQSGGQLPNTGPDVPVGQATLIAGLLALIGAAMLFAGRRPSARTAGRHSAS
jgi:hypothetical protein